MRFKVEKPYDCQIERLSRWLVVRSERVTTRHSLYKYTENGVLDWFVFKGKKYALGQFRSLVYPMMFEENGSLSYVSKYEEINNFRDNPLLIEVDYDGEPYVRVYREVEVM